MLVVVGSLLCWRTRGGGVLVVVVRQLWRVASCGWVLWVGEISKMVVKSAAVGCANVQSVDAYTVEP